MLHDSDKTASGKPGAIQYVVCENSQPVDQEAKDVVLGANNFSAISLFRQYFGTKT